MAPHADARLFAGVRFALYGFNTLSESQYRLELVRCGGVDVDVGPWDGDCTHVIVSDTLYDDPVCVAARKDKKKVVTEQWVEDSLELGELADADRVLYAPIRDPNGIPGSDELHICLTGYQKNWRGDIMKMVSLMGAHFSKSLRANEDTHLICYKFEGEKYELAKQVNIKIVNHRWLEECLKAWEILPIDDYMKSGWEVEIMEAQAKDSEDESEDVGRGSSSGRCIGRSTPVTEIRTKSHVDSAVNSPVRGPTISTSNTEGATGRHFGTPEQSMKAEDASTKSFDIRAESGSAPDTKYATVSVDGDAHKTYPYRIYQSENDEAPADQISRVEAKDHKRDTDTRASTLCTPNVHKSIAPAILADNRKIIEGNCLHSSNQINVNNDLRSNASEENCSKQVVHSPEMSRKVEQKDDRHIPDPQPTISQSFAEERLNMHESSLGPEDNSASISNQILGYSRRRPAKSVSPGANLRSAHQTPPPQRFKGDTSRVELIATPTGNNQDFSGHAETRGMQEKEVIKHANRSGGGHAQKRKSVLSSFSSKAPSEAPDSQTGKSSKENASEAAVSNLGRSPAESTKVGGHLNSDPAVNFSEKKMTGSFKSNLLSNRKTSLKVVSSTEVEKLPEDSSKDKNIVALGEVNTPALHETTIERRRAIAPSVDSEVRKESSGASLQNGDTEVTDAQHVNKIEAAGPCSKPEKVVSHQELEANPKDIPVNKVTDKHGTFPPKVSTSRVRNSGAKRSRNADNKAAPGLINSKSGVATKPMHDKVTSHGNVETQQAEGFCSPNAAKNAPSFAAEVLNKKSRNEVQSSSLGPNRKRNESLVSSKVESVNMPLHTNTKGNHRKLSSTASTDENKGSSSQRGPYSESSKSIAKGSWTADVNMADSPTIDTTETIPSKSSFNEALPPENGEEHHQMLPSSARADDHEIHTANKVPNNRVRKVVAKRKLSSVQKQKTGTEPCITANVLASGDKVVSSERAAQSSRNSDMVTVDQDLENTSEVRTNGTVGLLCKDAMEERSKDTQSSKSRSNKRQKTADLVDGSTDYDKENMPVNSNFTSKTRAGNNSMSSKSTAKALQNSKVVLDERGMREGNNCGTLNVLEPTWFILSGHRLLRKEYKAILRRLKGRVCRDSHHWCFQATHLVTTELRRTEKFFAAAAAGRWILKPDYLTACNEAGKFVEEEPFEWHGNGLYSGDTISLDAPRKWRQLKQRTGHGAFYGMQVIIYGECIAPTLDTLKRTIRSGDGTILATSPPYTRFLKSSIDFAIVSVGMPSVDAWVHEFVRHNIPCVSADYLVEHVCKPGHPLSKHVLFSMHDLAEKSLQKLLKNQEDVMDADAGEESEGDIGCSTCGSHDEEGLMVTCGSGGNQAGCGVRVHVGCCNPPVDGEWLCGKCEEQKSAKKSACTWVAATLPLMVSGCAASARNKNLQPSR